MTSTFEDSVLDFDINLFQQSSNNALVPINKDKIRKAIFISKRKIMSTDSLIRKFYDKRMGCRALERCLLTSKEEYKQACIESMDYREKCTTLEEEIKKLETSNLELEQKCTMANNRFDGMQSHAKQLQQLVKENETQIESLKIEQKLEKANSREQEKKIANLQREHELLIKNISSISEVVFGKKKLTKELKLFLTKYGTQGAVNDCDSEEHSCDEADSLHTPMSPLSDTGECNEELDLPTTKEIKNKIGAKLEGLVINAGNTPSRDDNDHDSECSNEVVSLDTGRGSSLAFSDSDKCFNSPEYFSQHSPLGAEVNKEKVTVDTATSPVPIRQFTNVATSPVIFESLECLPETELKSPRRTITNCSCENKKEISSMPNIMIDRVVSPIVVTRSMEKSTSPLKNATKDIAVATSPLKLGDATSDCCNDNNRQNTHEKECLKLNQSCLEDENSNDGEIQMILDTMRFSKKLITPLPTTPAKSRNLQVTTGNIATQTVLLYGMCPEAAKIREENITLQATVAKLANDITNINNFLLKLNPLIKNDTPMETVGAPFVSKDAVAEAKDTEKPHQQKLEHNSKQKIHESEEIPSGIEKLDFNDKKSKLAALNSLLFDDSSPPSSSCGFLPPQERAPASLFSPTPSLSMSPAPSVAPPPPASLAASASPALRVATSPPGSPRSPPPPPASPSHPGSPHTPDSLRLIGDNDHASSDDDYEDNNNVKTKDRLQFEEPLLNQGILSDDAMSDHEYEHQIVIELPPDCLESDTNSIHEILKEQVSKEKPTLEDKNNKKTHKVRKVTKLEKLRKKMMPKGKIKKVDILSKRKRRIQPKRLLCKEQSKSDNALNSKAAYEKACKVMAEIKSKEEVVSKVIAPRLPIYRKRNSRKTSGFVTSNDLNTQENKPIRQSEKVVHDGFNEKTSENSPPQLTKDIASNVVKNKTYNKNVQDISKTVSEPPTRGCQRIVRTRSQTKSISADNSDDSSASLIQNIEDKDLVCHNREATRLDKPLIPQPQSPSQTRPALKMYGRNRDKNYDSRNTSGSNFAKPYLPTVTEEINISNNVDQLPENRKRLKRPSLDQPDLSPKRMLRSSAMLSESEITCNESETFTEKIRTHANERLLNYEDLDMFDGSPVKDKQKSDLGIPKNTCDAQKPRRAEHPKFGILCAFLDKYGGKSQNPSAPKISENVVDAICKKLEDDIAEIQKLSPKDTKQAMDKLVQDLKSRKQIQLLSGLLKYLKNPARKIELYNKVYVPPAPPMTKAEQILIYIVSQLKVCWPDIVENILKNIEYSLFMLNRTPDFDVIETLSHVYAILCRYDKNRNRLRLFIIDAMYCLQFKAVPLIRQCVDVWMHILPLAHMGIAKNPLVTCLVYLLHFYKCEDRFNRVQEIRNILNKKYFYEMSEWNEIRILEMFKTSIIELRDIAVEKKMLRIALIILAKRHGARWCQKYIVKSMLLPLIDQTGVPDHVKCFCASLLGPLLKPYPVEMKVNCEIVINQLFDVLDRNPSKQMEEAIFTTLIYMNRHNQNRVIKSLLFWKPDNVSPEFQDLLKNYVKGRPMKSWKTVLSKISLQQT